MQALIGYALQFLRQTNEKMVHVYCWWCTVWLGDVLMYYRVYITQF